MARWPARPALPAVEGQLGIRVNGIVCTTTLQIPHGLLHTGDNEVAICPGADGPLLIRSTVEHHAVEGGVYHIEAFGAGECVLADPLAGVTILDVTGSPLPVEVSRSGDGRGICRFTAWGRLTLYLDSERVMVS